ncbi:prophage antirepressor [Thiovulum sp. ES]|nr:prophage antirepressor [Thiovulum sp. ES]
MQTIPFQNGNNLIEIEVIENDNFEFLLSTKEVAKGYGVSIENIRSQKSNHKDELIEGKHFLSNYEVFDGKQKRKTTVWTKRGVIRLGFFIKSEQAKKFRDWAEDLILQKVGNYFSQNFNLTKLEERARVLEISEKEFGIFERVFYKIGITRKEELAITSNRAVAKETGVDFLKIAEKKGLSTTEKYYTVTELCEIVMSGDFSEEAKKLVSTKKGDKPRPQNLNKFLQELGLQTKDEDVWKTTLF